MICDARYVYVRRRDAGPLLFDRFEDPDELRNAAADNAARARELDQLLSAHLSHAS
jgi:hypothetical protein